MQDKELLQKQVCEQLKQITQLRSQVNELTLSTASQSVTDVEQRSAGVEHLQLRVDELNGALQVRDREVRWPPLLLCLFSLCRICVCDRNAESGKELNLIYTCSLLCSHMLRMPFSIAGCGRNSLRPESLPCTSVPLQMSMLEPLRQGE